MKNEYMFFEENQFDMVDLLEYKKEDISIPKTSIHIYSFSCADGMDGFENEEMQAKKLDELTIMLDIHYNNKYKIIYSESSRFFCNELYPLIVEFETLLRKTLYISRALYNSGEINSESFKYLDDKKEKTIEELEFGTIYTCIFTDKNLKPEILKKYTYPMTKSDLIDIINEIPEETEWRKWVGTQYNFIENNFIKIKDG